MGGERLHPCLRHEFTALQVQADSSVAHAGRFVFAHNQLQKCFTLCTAVVRFRIKVIRYYMLCSDQRVSAHGRLPARLWDTQLSRGRYPSFAESAEKKAVSLSHHSP
jgi:hypothetical protein